MSWRMEIFPSIEQQASRDLSSTANLTLVTGKAHTLTKYRVQIILLTLHNFMKAYRKLCAGRKCGPCRQRRSFRLHLCLLPSLCREQQYRQTCPVYSALRETNLLASADAVGITPCVGTSNLAHGRFGSIYKNNWMKRKRSISWDWCECWGNVVWLMALRPCEKNFERSEFGFLNFYNKAAKTCLHWLLR